MVCAPQRVSGLFPDQSNKRYDFHYKAFLAFLEYDNHSTTPCAESGVHGRSICFVLSAVVMVAHFEASFKI